METLDKYLKEYFANSIDNKRYPQWLKNRQNYEDLYKSILDYDINEIEEQKISKDILKPKSQLYHSSVRDAYNNKDYVSLNNAVKNRLLTRAKIHDFDFSDFTYRGNALYKPRGWSKIDIIDLSKEYKNIKTLNTGDSLMVMQVQPLPIKVNDITLDPAQRYLLQFNVPGQYEIAGRTVTVVGSPSGNENIYRIVENPIRHVLSNKTQSTGPSIIKPKIGDDIALPIDYFYANSDFTTRAQSSEGLHYIKKDDNSNIYTITKPNRYYFKNSGNGKVVVDCTHDADYNWNNDSFGIVEMQKHIKVPCKLKFTSSDNHPHDVYLADEHWRPAIKLSDSQSRLNFDYYLSEPGTYRFVCSNCENMKMIVHAKKSPYLIKMNGPKDHCVYPLQDVIFQGDSKERSLCGRDSIIVSKCKNLKHKTQFDSIGKYEFKDPTYDEQYNIHVSTFDPINILQLLPSLPVDLELEFKPEYLDHIRKCYLKCRAKKLCKHHLGVVPKEFDKLLEHEHYQFHKLLENNVNFMNFYSNCGKLRHSVGALVLDKLKKQKHADSIRNLINNLYAEYKTNPLEVSERIYKSIDSNGELDLEKLAAK